MDAHKLVKAGLIVGAVWLQGQRGGSVRAARFPARTSSIRRVKASSESFAVLV